MKIGIIIKGRSWTFQLANSLNKSGNLYKLITTYPKFYLNKYNVPLDKTNSVFFLYIFENIISRFFHPILKKLKINYDPMVFVDWLADTIFSHFYLSKCDFLLVGFGASTKKIIQKAKNKKIKTIYFLNTTHTNSKYQKIVENEYKKFGLSEMYLKEPISLSNRIHESIEMADYIGALSTSQKESFIDAGFDESKMFLNLMGVDTSLFFPKKVNNDKFIVLTNGNNFIRKGIKYLIDAFNSLKLENSELWIVGKNDINLAKKIVKIEKNNIFKNRLKYEFDLPTLYNKADIFCLPSFEEGLPAVIPQAMACGIPIISSHFAKDIVTDGKEGFIIKPGNVIDIAEKIKFFYDNPKLRLEMGKNARIRAENSFSYDLIAKRIINLCNKSYQDNKL